ncbi:MAG TPA: hypothetical protein VK451_05245, partial [Methyloceanibacter sp.]|nr:hypothetical protein [Methyloceanibacter sp.]
MPSGPTGTPDTPGTPDNPPPPIHVNARVLSPPNVYTAYGIPLDNQGDDHHLLGGDDRPEVNADDFIWTFNLGPDRLQATVTGLIDGSNDFQPATIDLPATFPLSQCSDGVCAINLSDNASLSQAGQTTQYTGLSVLKPNFFAYDIVAATNLDSNNHPDRLLAFGGTGYTFAAPSGKIYSFALTPDILEAGAFGPFASSNSSPVASAFVGLNSYENSDHVSQGIGFVSPLVLLEKDNAGASDQSQVWLQTSFFVGKGDNQGSSFINVSLGNWNAQDGITGSRRGGSIVLGGEESSPQTFSFSGDIASLAG